MQNGGRGETHTTEVGVWEKLPQVHYGEPLGSSQEQAGPGAPTAWGPGQAEPAGGEGSQGKTEGGFP